MMRLLVILTLVVFASCDSSVDMSHSDRSVSVSIQTAQQFYEDYHKRYNKSSDDSIKVVVLAEMVRQYPPDWTQAVAWSDGQGGAYVATLIGADKPAISFSHDSVSVIRTLMADVNSDGTVTGSRLLKFISIDHLDPTQFQRYVKQWILGDYGESTMMVAEFTLGFESQTAQLSLPQDSLKVPVGISLKEVSKYGKVEDESRWCYVSDYIRGGWICFQGADGCKNIPAIIDLTCICTSMCDNDQGRTGTGNGNPTGGTSPPAGGEDVKNPDEKEEDKCECSAPAVCDLISEYESLNVGFTPNCYSFRTAGSTANFSWNEFMGGWSDGNDYGKHRTYGIMN